MAARINMENQNPNAPALEEREEASNPTVEAIGPETLRRISVAFATSGVTL